MLGNRRAHGDIFCVGVSLLSIVIGLVALRSVFLLRPSTEMLMAFAVVSILAQVIHLMEHGMTPVGGTASFINFVAAIFIIRYLLGNFSTIEDLLGILLPIVLIIEMMKNFVP